MAQVADPTDERKRLLSALLESPALIVIDNVEHPLRSDSLCIALTEPSFTDRLLGVSRTVTVATNCSFFATGNNLVVSGDLSARALVCRIDPEVERPEERTFAVNLHEWVPAHRGELVGAGLTVIKAYLAAGEPKQSVPNFARFEDWQRLCRFPLTWLGLTDPCETRRRIEASDPVRETLRALLSAWHRRFGDGRATVKAAIEAAPTAGDLQTASIRRSCRVMKRPSRRALIPPFSPGDRFHRRASKIRQKQTGNKSVLKLNSGEETQKTHLTHPGRRWSRSTYDRHRAS